MSAIGFASSCKLRRPNFVVSSSKTHELRGGQRRDRVVATMLTLAAVDVAVMEMFVVTNLLGLTTFQNLGVFDNTSPFLNKL